MTLERKQQILDYQRAFSSEEGQKVLEDLSRVCYEKRTTFWGDNERMSAFTEGKRWVMLHIRELIAANPDETEPVKALTQEDENYGRGD